MSAQNPPSVHFEVYTQDGGGRWNLHARYAKSEREAAMADAKNVEKTLQIPAKVVREVYYSGNNVSEESTIYTGNPELKAKVMARASAMPSYRGRGGGDDDDDDGGSDDSVGASIGRGAREFLGASSTASVGTAAKFALVLAVAFTIAGIAAGLVNMAMQSMADQISDAVISLILLLTFSLTFVATALPLAISVMNVKLFGFGGGGSSRAKAKKEKPRAKERPKPVKAAAPPKETAPADDEPDQDILAIEDEIIPSIIDEDDVQADDESAAEAEPSADDSEKPAEVVAEGPADGGTATFVRFVNGLVAAVRRVRPTLDAFNMFGVDLVMAGAIDVLGQTKAMPADERRKVLKSAIAAMGVKAATAQAFADKYEEYLVEPRYMPMIMAGRSTMESFLNGHDTLQEAISAVFLQWNKPQANAQAGGSRIQTVMFTDMVGSTDLTQAQGDQAAQHLVRRHNTIVRNALAQYAGKEIKHTGDGIMASFASATNGVESTIAIQRAIAKHNAERPDQELHVRIGINSGEPIEEEEDLFGSTVQLAARVCARAGTDEIFCSNVVKELAGNRGLNFESLGPQDLKGFKEKILLFQIEWRG